MIEINPLPTRVWGIGFQKTATTSLAKALTIIGFDCAHWSTPRWARIVWNEMQRYGKSLTLERHYAATDFPIALLFKELERAYPGSRFILTVRDEKDWLQSVERHFSDANPWRDTWDKDCFSHRMHQITYGRRNFDAAIFLERYRRHNAEVREYFRDRPGDLLEMIVGWQDLCPFLGAKIPAIPYPKLNVS